MLQTRCRAPGRRAVPQPLPHRPLPGEGARVPNRKQGVLLQPILLGLPRGRHALPHSAALLCVRVYHVRELQGASTSAGGLPLRRGRRAAQPGEGEGMAEMRQVPVPRRALGWLPPYAMPLRGPVLLPVREGVGEMHRVLPATMMRSWFGGLWMHIMSSDLGICGLLTCKPGDTLLYYVRSVGCLWKKLGHRLDELSARRDAFLRSDTHVRTRWRSRTRRWISGRLIGVTAVRYRNVTARDATRALSAPDSSAVRCTSHDSPTDRPPSSPLLPPP